MAPGALNGELHHSRDDDWGMPFKSPRPLPYKVNNQTKRFRTPILIALFILALIYWLYAPPLHSGPREWSRFAYVQYATDAHSMCNAFMVFEALHRLGSKADRVVLFPESWNSDQEDPNDRNSQLLIRAKRNYGVQLRPTQILGPDGGIEPGTLDKPSDFGASATKLRIFELDDYERVLYFDSDVLVQHHMDELFTLIKTPVAMPRAYWSRRPPEQWPLSSALMLIQPNSLETEHMWDRLQEWRLQPDRDVVKDYDERLLNDRFGPSALVLPHRPYFLQTSVFRSEDSQRRAYMGTHNAPDAHEKWDPHLEVKAAKLVHFDDWPLPKPWVEWPLEGLKEIQPDCGGSHIGTCGDREMWKRLYEDFRYRRKDLCKILTSPAPDWSEWKNLTGASD